MNQPLNYSELSDQFESLLKEYDAREAKEGSVVKGQIVRIEKGIAYIDIGHKREGAIPVEEFLVGEEGREVAAGDVVEVYLSRIENSQGRTVLSRVEAVKKKGIESLEKAMEDKKPVEGIVFSRVKGGFTVDLNGVVAFLPGSQVDIRPVRDVSALMNVSQMFRVLKIDRVQGNIVVSRRAILEESRAEERDKLLSQIAEGQVMEGVVKNITEYGAFIDLGSIDGLLHVTDISWNKINHPSEMLKVGQVVRVQIIKYNPETKRVSLGMKQLEENPWKGVERSFPRGTKVTGTVTNVTDYGVFVKLSDEVEGLVHVSEISWIKNNTHPRDIFSVGQQVECVVLEVDAEKHRISLGMKQCADNPWSNFAEQHPVGSVVEGEIRNMVDFGVFLGFGEIDGLVHVSDLTWDDSGSDVLRRYQKGQKLAAQVLAVDVDKERISLGVKQAIKDNPFEGPLADRQKGDHITCTVSAVYDDGIDVEVCEGVVCFIKRSELSRDRVEQRTNRFAVGDRIDAKVVNLDRKAGKISVSIKALEVEEHKKVIAEYGSSDSGASLGDILGAALSKAESDKK